MNVLSIALPLPLPYLLLLIPIISVLRRLVINAFKFVHLQHIPFPTSSPFSLVTLIFRSDPSQTAQWINASFPPERKLFKLSGFLLNTNVLALSSESVRTISSLPATFPKPPVVHRFIKTFTGPESIFSATGIVHRHLRTAISPSLRHDHIISYLQHSFFKEARTIASALGKHADDKHIVHDVFKQIRVGTFRVVMQACFGVDRLPLSEMDVLCNLYHTALKQNPLIILLSALVLPEWFPTWLISKAERARIALLSTTKQLCDRLLQRPDEVPKNSVLAHMIEINAKENAKFVLNGNQLMGIVLTFLLAGQATTTITITWALYHLARDIKLQNDLYASLCSLPSSDQDNLEELDRLQLLDGVVKESLRLYPPVNYILRNVASSRPEQGGMYVDGIFVPNDTTLRVPVLGLHTRTDVWGEDALEFKPQRWSDGSLGVANSKVKWYFTPFWHGSHNCVGQRFATLEVKAFLKQILILYQVKVVDEAQPRRVGTSSAPQSLSLKFEPRQTIKTNY